MSARDLRIYKYLLIEIFLLITLGGAVRAMNAGLACPDWPLCFGDVIPDYHPQVYFEFIHRALAGLVGFVTIYINYKLIRSRTVKKSVKVIAGVSVGLLLAQIVMGGLTVLLLLQDKVVALHLALGTGFFAFSFWNYLTLRYSENFPGSVSSGQAKTPTVIMLAAVYCQLLLGGLVASNYAALVCVDFPTCNGQFIPTLKGVIGLHVIHRLGAYALTLISIACVTFILRKTQCLEIKKWSQVFLVGVLFQISLGVANVKFFTPPLITVLHLAMATALLAVTVKLVRTSTWASAQS